MASVGTVGAVKTGRRTATAWFLRLLVLAAVVVVVFVPPFSSEQDDTARITRFAGDFELSADGKLAITETIDVEMPGGKHGIFRIFDVADNHRYGVEHPVSDVSVTRDGAPEPWEWTDSAAGTETMRIGSASVFLTPGQHQYVIRSTTTDTLERGADGTVVWWWNVTETPHMMVDAFQSAAPAMRGVFNWNGDLEKSGDFDPGADSKKFDELVAKADVESDQDARNDLFKQAEELALKNAVYIPLGNWVQMFLQKAWLQGTKQGPWTGRIPVWFDKDVVVVKH